MHSFLWIAGMDAEQAQHRARAALGALKDEWIDIGAELQVTLHAAVGFEGAFATLGPVRDYSPPLFDVFHDEDLLVFCFGRVTDARSSARRVMRAYRSAGVDAARRLDGSFAAVVCHPQRQEFEAFTDLVGMKGIRCARTGDSALLASHDLALVAAGATEARLDLDSAASLVACDWSLGSRSLLGGVQVCGGNQVARYEQRQLTVSCRPALTLADRVEASDRRRVRQTLEQLATAWEDAANTFVAHESSVRFSLTAGEDSRVLLALLSRFRNKDLLSQTNGSLDSQDVRVARRLARWCGIKHRINTVSTLEVGAFASMVRLLSMSMNGMTNAKRALAPLPRWSPERGTLAGGEGGEIYTGFFYRAAHKLHDRARPELLTGQLIQHRFKRLNSLGFVDAACRGRVQARLTAVLDELSQISTQTHDLLDLFYLYERYALWGSFGEHCTWTRRWTPFNNTAAVQLAYRLPSPIGINCTAHELVMRRHLPWRAYLMPINGSESLLLTGGGKWRQLIRRATKETIKRATARVSM